MVVCHCKAVFEREVRELVRAGAASRPAIARACGAGSDCGGCRPVLDEIIAEETGVPSLAACAPYCASRSSSERHDSVAG